MTEKLENKPELKQAHFIQDMIDQYSIDPMWLLERIAKPKFEETDEPLYKAIHDWRAYIPMPVRNRWAELDDKVKTVAICMAEEQSQREEWD